MNDKVQCNENDLNADLNDFFLDSNSETREETQFNASQSKLDKFLLKKINTEENDQCCCGCNCYRVLVLINDFLYFFLFYIGFIEIIVSVLFSFLFCIITVFTFFVSFITSYIMCPVYHSLNNDWKNFIPAIFQVFLSSPLVAFFIFFFINLIRKVGDLLDYMVELFKIPFTTKHNQIEGFSEQSDCYMIVSNLALILFDFLGFLFLWVTFMKKNWCLYIGFLISIPTLFEIIVLLIPVYVYWFKILFNKEFTKDFQSDDFSKKNEKCVSRIIKLVRRCDYESDDDDEEKINQETQTFLTERGQISAKIGYSVKEHDVEDITSFSINDTKEDKELCPDCSDIKCPNNKCCNIKCRKIQCPKFILFFVMPFRGFISKLRHLYFMKELIPLYDFAKQIVQNIHRKTTKRVLLWIFTILNIALIIVDIFRAIKNPDIFFIAATTSRFLLLPLFSYYHLFTHFLVTIKDKTLRIVNHVAFAFTLVSFIAILGCLELKNYNEKYVRIDEYQHMPINESLQYYNYDHLSHPVCLFNLYDVNAIEAYSYAIAVYDINRNKKVFDEEMKTFFGENYSSFIDINVKVLSNKIPFVIYKNKLINTTIVAFRGFSSGPEIAFLLQTIAEYYVVPFFTELVPFMDTITEFFLDEPIEIAHEFGRMMFDPTNTVYDTYEEIIDICIDEGIDQLDRVLFTGIGIGSTFGKLVSIYLKKYSISFMSLPVWNDFFEKTFELEENDMGFVTTVYTYNSYMSKPEPDFATNIGLYPTKFHNYIDPTTCNSDLCKINFKGETNYPTFCLIAGMCGFNAKFDHFCNVSLPNHESDLMEINNFVKYGDGEDDD